VLHRDTTARLPEALALVALLLSAVVYVPTLAFKFVYDDGWTLLANGFLRVPEQLMVLFSSDAVRQNVPDAFRPTLVVFDVLTYQGFGLDAFAHHATSVSLHVCACVAFERWLASLGAPWKLRVAWMACFGVLAIHAEAVAVVSFREDLLAAVFGFAALALAGRIGAATSLHIRSARGLGAAMLSILACGAKASAAALPLVGLLAWTVSPWQRGPRWRDRCVMFVAMAVGPVLLAWHTFHLYGDLTPYGGAENLRVYASRVGLGPVLAASARIHVAYLQQIAVPFGLGPEYVDAGASTSDPVIMLAIAALVVLFATALACTRMLPVVTLAVLGWMLACVPTSNWIGVPNMRADRFMYIASAPVCIGLAAALLRIGELLQRATAKRVSMFVPLLAFVIVQGSALQATVRTYRNDATLWEVASQFAPDSARAQALRGLMLLSAAQGAGRAELPDPEALSLVRARCERAEQLDPEYELPQLCFARLAVSQRDWVNAYERFSRAYALSYDRTDRIRAALAQVAMDLPLAFTSAPERLALDHLRAGLEAYPYSSELHAVAGRIFHQMGDPQRALQYYRRARKLRPERWEIVASGLELALDLGHAAAAQRTWADHWPLLLAADAPTRGALGRMVADASHLFPPTVLEYLLTAGAFPDVP